MHKFVFLPARLLACWLCAFAVCCFCALPPAALSQQPGTVKTSDNVLGLDPRAWAEDAAANEVKMMDNVSATPLRFRERKVDAKGDTTREVIETKEGTVARLVQRNGQPLTSQEDTAERARLQQDIDSPSDFLKHHEKDRQARQDATQLVLQMPAAMLFTYAPGQPQLPDVSSTQVVLDFRPNPAFHPPTMRAELLTGIEGRLWIDTRTKRMTRVEGHVLHSVDMGFGFVARLFPGGSVVLDQANVGSDRWVYSHLVEHMTFRILMIKTIPQNSEMTTWDYRPMPSLLPFADAIRILLAMHLPLRLPS